jgi:RHS repeat-associated protein
MAAGKHLAIDKSIRQLFSLLFSLRRPTIQSFFLACLLIFFTTEISAQETTTTQSTTTATAPADPPVAPVEKPAPKSVPTASALSAAGLSAGAGGGLPGVSGRVPGMAKVEASGGASYAVPIVTPPGRAGIQPALAFLYDSQHGNGLLGMGWSISGLPTIHRCPKRLEPDGISGGVNYTTEDRYCLDGSRLMAVSGAYGGNNTEYRTEVDNGIKIISYNQGQSGSGPAWFEGRTKDGKILEFGNGGDSDIQAANDSQGQPRSDIRVWALSSIRDTKGNKLTVTYTRDNTNGHYNPNQISYTSNTGLAADRFVVFSVEDRPDSFPMYVGGSVVTIAKRITNVKTYVGGTAPGNLVRDYKLTYECNTGDCNTVTKRSRLKTISECDKDGNCLPAETPQSVSYTFGYQEGGDNSFTYAQFDVDDSKWDGLKAWTGDFNADGAVDIASKAGNSMWVHLSDGAGNFIPVETPVDTTKFDGDRVWVGDLNGDGRSDFTTLNNGKLWTYLAKNDDSGHFENPILYQPQSSQISDFIWLIDIDGDGRMDLVSRANNRIHTYLSNFSGTSGNFTYLTGLYVPDYQFDKNHVWPGDYNGDNKQDLLTYNNGNLWAHLSNGSGGYSAVYTTVGGSNFDAGQAWSGDINGDGLSDIVSLSNGLKTYLSMGNGYFADGVETHPGSAYFDNIYTWAIDVNGDGRTDLVSQKNGQLHAHFSNGNGTYWRVSTTVEDYQFERSRVWLGDFTGDGKGDLLSSKNGKLHTHSADIIDATNMFPDLLVTINSMFGAETSIVHKPLTDSSVYTKYVENEPLLDYPFIHLRLPQYVVSAMEVTDPGDPALSYTYSYLYQGSKAHVRGRGSLGFKIMDALDANVGARTITYFNQGLDAGAAQFTQNFPKAGMPDTVEIEDSACSPPNNALVDSRNIYDVSSDPYPNSGVRRILLTQTDKNEYECTDTPRYTNTTFSYDSFGNLAHTYRQGVTGTADDIDEVTEWVVNSSLWIHRPKTVQVSGYENGQYKTFREKWLYYDGRNHGDETMPFGLITKEEGNGGDPQGSGNNNPVTGKNPVTTYEYEDFSLNFGVLTYVTDPRGCRTRTVYEATWTFPQTITTCVNSFNYPMGYTYDARFGVKTTETDWNGQPTVWDYDTFGRVIKMTNAADAAAGSPNGTIKYEYRDWGTPNLQRVETHKTIDYGSASVLKTQDYFDGFGRVDLTHSDGPNGRTIVTQSAFNSRNQVRFKWVPYYDGIETPLQPIEFRYDALGRETLMIHPDNRSAGKFYSPGAVTFTDERNVQKIHILDPHGRLIQVQEKNNGGADTYYTDYAYDAAGSLTLVRNNESHYTTMKYDLLGRKEAMCDPNMGASPSNTSCTTATAGAWVYTYSPAGDLVTQKDAKNQTICFEYDALGRPTIKKEGDATCPTTGTTRVTWTYDTSQNISPPVADNPKGKLTKVMDEGTNPVTTMMAYDSIGRVSKTRRELMGVPYDLSQSYDSMSRIKTETLPDPGPPETVTYNYDGPWVESVADYITNIDYNARGQKTSLTYADNFNTTTTWNYYDEPGDTRKNFAVKDRVAGSTIQNLHYEYDDGNNLVSIEDHLASGTAWRNFQYDDLSRLTYAEGAFGANQSLTSCTYQYNAIGNITNKCGVTFEYNDPMHPSAVTRTRVGINILKDYHYDNNGNMDTRGIQTLTWDADNRVTSVSIQGGGTTSMYYDYTGQRVRKDAAAGTTLFPFQGIEIDPSGVMTKFIRIGIETFASMKSTGEKRFYHNDHLGGVNVITDENVVEVQRNEYDPWGTVSKAVGNYDPTHRFNGKELDPETGLYYYGGRYYDPEISRFISPDPFVPQPGNPQALNRYSYTINNPQKYIDPSGYFFLFDWFKKARHAFHELWEFTKKAWRAVLSSPVGRIIFSAVVGWATGYIVGPAGLGLVSASMATSVGGAAAGATLSGLSGGNPLLGAVTGFVAAGGLGGGIIGDFGFSGSTELGTFAAEAANVSIRGFVVGTLGSLAAGSNFSTAIHAGFLSAAFHLGGVEFNNLVGHTVGLILSGGRAPTFRNALFWYDAPQAGGFVAIGNAVTGPQQIVDTRATVQGLATNYSIRLHELIHWYQSGALTVAYLPIHILDKAISLAITWDMSAINRYDPFERWLHPFPSY